MMKDCIGMLRVVFLAVLLVVSVGIGRMSGETLERFLSEPWRPPLSPQIVGFSDYGGRWHVEDGVLLAPAGAGFRLVCDSFESRGEVVLEAEVFLEPGKNGNTALISNVRRCGIGADAFDGYEFAIYADTQRVMIGRHEQNFTQLASFPCCVPTGEWVRFRVKSSRTQEGNLLEAWLNDEKCGSTLDTRPLPDGRVGVRPWQRTARYRNFQVQGENIDFHLKPKESKAWPESLCSEDLPPILVVCRGSAQSPPAVGQDFWAGKIKTPGCAMKIIYPAEPKREVRTIFEDTQGVIYDANLSLDAKEVFFSYRKFDETYWNLFKIRLDGSGLTRLTSGAFHDFSPLQVPSGDIVFVSTRHAGYTVCQPGPASNLFRMDAHGGNIECVSMNTLSDFNPQLLPDGRIIFTRWEYIDRDLTYRQSLWTQNADGSGYQLYFGNTIRDFGSILHARPVPGRSDLLVATFAPHHGYPHGAIGFVRRNSGPESELGVGFEYITREFGSIRDTSREWAYRDPFPLSDTQFLCAYGGERDVMADSADEGDRNASMRAPRYRIYLLNAQGEKRLIYEAPETERGCYCPLPIVPRQGAYGAAPLRLLEKPAQKEMGLFILADVYAGLEPFVKRGEVRKIRVMEQVRKSEDLAARAYDQSPVMSYGTYYAKRCWGEIPVESDGSAYFYAPAMREIYFQALDAEGMELQRMTSSVLIMPGGKMGCIGCHENRTHAPYSIEHAAMPLALRREPSELQMPEWWEAVVQNNEPTEDPLAWRTLDYASLVQPVLDEYCVSCHSGPDPDGG
ncbi:MAG: hypothetical protein Q4D38_05605, partial [Planctomycetia bacterium]|nr:hypothetical protein [Planctomycetia bacterium]